MTATETDGPDGAEPRALLARARGLSEAGHPAAQEVWQRLEEAVRTTGVALKAAERAELIDHRAMAQARSDPAGGAGRFAEAARLHAGAGEPGQAVAASARGALATAFAGRPEEALQQLEGLCTEAVALHSAGRAGVRHATAVLLSRARVRELLLPAADDDERPRAVAALDAELADLVAFAEPERAQPAVLARIADATESRGRLLGQSGEVDRSTELLREAAALYHSAGRPWQATGAEIGVAERLLAEGRAEEAEAALRTALGGDADGADGADSRAGADDAAGADGTRGRSVGRRGYPGRREGAGERSARAPHRPPEDTARLLLVLSGALDAQQRHGEQADCLSAAVRLADSAGEHGGLGARARLRLGALRLELGEPQPAAETLESALEGLLAGEHDDGRVAAARRLLGEAWTETGRHEEAAQQFLTAAETVRRAAHAEGDRAERAGEAAQAAQAADPEQAMLVHLAADALRASGHGGDAAAAYERAEELWHPLGETCARVRALRSRAWLALGELTGISGRAEGGGQPPDDADEAYGAHGAYGTGTGAGSAATTAVTKAVGLMAGALREMESGLQTADGPEQRLRLQLELGRTYQQSAELLLHTTSGPPDESRNDPQQYAVDRAAYQEASVHAEHALTVFHACGDPALEDRTGVQLLLAGLEAELGKAGAAASRAHAVLAALPGPHGADAVADERREAAHELLARLGEP